MLSMCPVGDVGVLWPNGRMDQDATWYGCRPQPRPQCVRLGPSPRPQRGIAPKQGHNPQFPAHVCCGHTVESIRMPIGVEVGLGPGHIALDGDPAPPEKRHSSPHFSVHVYCGQRAGQTKVPLVT